MTEYRDIGPHRLYLGDCLEILPTLGAVDAVVTDPPYGMKWDGKVKRARRHSMGIDSRFKGKTIVGDDKDFDPSPFMGFKYVILWGAHHYLQHLHRGTILVWLKKYPNAFGSFLSDADIAWMNKGHGVYCSNVVNPASFQHEREHPTQKPVAVMEWCLSFIPKAHTVLDPFMGSGTTAVACHRTGRRCIGIEIDPGYFEIACTRLERAIAHGRQPGLFDKE